MASKSGDWFSWKPVLQKSSRVGELSFSWVGIVCLHNHLCGRRAGVVLPQEWAGQRLLLLQSLLPVISRWKGCGICCGKKNSLWLWRMSSRKVTQIPFIFFWRLSFSCKNSWLLPFSFAGNLCKHCYIKDCSLDFSYLCLDLSLFTPWWIRGDRLFFCLLILRVTDQLLVTALKSDKPPIQSALLFHNRLLFSVLRYLMNRKFKYTIYYFNKYIENHLCTKFYPLYFLRFIVRVLSQPVLPHCWITFQEPRCLTCKSWAVLQQDCRYWQRWSCPWNPCMANTCISFSRDFRALYLDGSFYWIELLRKAEWGVCISLHLQWG